jgi:hypothetical protein
VSGKRAKDPDQAINLWQTQLTPQEPSLLPPLSGDSAFGGSCIILPLPSPLLSPQERPSSGPQGSCHPTERGLRATVHFGESLAEIIS